MSRRRGEGRADFSDKCWEGRAEAERERRKGVQQIIRLERHAQTKICTTIK